MVIDMSQKKKYKLKKKKFIIIFLILLLLVGGASIFGYSLLMKNTLKEIKTKYNEYVLTTHKAKLYNKHNKEVGTISSNYYLELTKIRNLTIKNKHLQIKNTPYYISYKDIKKTSKKELKKVEDSYYLDINKSLITKKKVDLLKDGKKIISLNELTTKIKRIDDDYYYIDFLNDTYSIKKNKNIKVKNLGKDKDESHLSVILYNKISDNCSEDTCFNPNSIKAHINKLKKDGFYFITLDDYLYYLKDYVNLKEKAILLVTNEESSFIKNIEDETKVKIYNIKDKTDLKFTNNNKKTTKNDKLNNLSNYYPKKYFIIDSYVDMANGKDIVDDGGKNTATEIPVVNYHFFYDSRIGEGCNESICLDAVKFEEQLKWLKDNNYKTLTINEFADWKDGYIELPEHSVLLTIDDGAMGTGKHNGNKLIPLLEKYQQHATLFLITGWWALDNYKSPYLDVQSHTHNLHYEAQCADGRGRVACSDYKTVKADLEQSIGVLHDTTSFCFPFYSYDRESLQALRELGFRVAFIGGNTRAKRSQDNLLVTRYPIMNDITLQQFINMVK